jgi:oxaloacetate decarboxylase alpha subunit
LYRVKVDGRAFAVEVSEEGEVTSAVPATDTADAQANGKHVNAPLSGNVFKILVSPGQSVTAGERVIVLEAMKMETDISAPQAGTVAEVRVEEGDAVGVDDVLLVLS